MRVSANIDLILIFIISQYISKTIIQTNYQNLSNRCLSGTPHGPTKICPVLGEWFQDGCRSSQRWNHRKYTTLWFENSDVWNLRYFFSLISRPVIQHAFAEEIYFDFINQIWAFSPSSPLWLFCPTHVLKFSPLTQLSHSLLLNRYTPIISVYSSWTVSIDRISRHVKSRGWGDTTDVEERTGTFFMKYSTSFIRRLVLTLFKLQYRLFPLVLVSSVITILISYSPGLRDFQVMWPRRDTPRCWEPVWASSELVRAYWTYYIYSTCDLHHHSRIPMEVPCGVFWARKLGVWSF